MTENFNVDAFRYASSMYKKVYDGVEFLRPVKKVLYGHSTRTNKVEDLTIKPDETYHIKDNYISVCPDELTSFLLIELGNNLMDDAIADHCDETIIELKGSILLKFKEDNYTRVEDIYEELS